MKNKNVSPDIKNGYIEETLVLDRDSLILRDSTSGDIIEKETIVSMLNDSAGDTLPKAILVDIEATHSGITKNFTEYMSPSMKSSASTWTTPYEKPVLREHNTSGMTLGRVKSYKFGQSILNSEKDTITLGLEITDKDSIRRHLDGTALTYSIGAQAKELFCSICGIDIINSDEFCGHWRGRTYEKKVEGKEKTIKEVAIWQIGKVEYLEVSEVNVPADVWAQRLSVTVKEEEAKDSVSTDEEDDVTDTTTTDAAGDVLVLVDSLLNPPEDETTEVPPVTEENTPPADTTLNDTLTEYNLVKDELEKLKVDMIAKEAELATSTTALQEALQQVASITNTSRMTYNLNVELAKTLKRVYAESIVDARIRLGQLDEASSDGEIKTLVIQSAKELSNTFTELREADKARTSLPHITQKDVGDDGALSVHQDAVDVGEETIKPTKIALTANEAANLIVNLKNKEE